MYLNKLVIVGFKSFVKKTSFEFNHPFTAIVGPNGGGKTNVVDALRWVMGEQSPKLLRLKKSEDAIFAGSKKLSRLGMAQVELHLNNHDGRLNLDYPEVIITRKLYRNGESEYLINKSKVRLSDIIMLLAKANFGQKSYGIIGQGMITDILNANPQDRKEFFDEATGVKEFQIKRDQAINKLIRTEDNLTRAEDLLQEIEPRLRSLHRQVRKLEKRKVITQELKELQIKYYGSLWQEFTAKQKLSSQQKKELALNQEEINKNIAQVQKLIDNISSQESRTTLYQKLQQDYNELLNQKNKLLKEQIVIKGKFEVDQQKQGKLNLVWLERKSEEVSHSIKKSELEINHFQTVIKQLEDKLKDQINQEQNINKNFKELEYDLLKAREQLQKAMEILSVPEIKERLVGIFNQQENFLKQLLDTTSLETFKQVQKEAKSVTTKLAELLDELHGKNNEEINAQKKKIEILEKQLTEKSTHKEDILKSINELRINIQTKKDKIALWQDNIKQDKQEQSELSKEIEDIKKQGQEKDKSKLVLEQQKTAQRINDQLIAIEEKLLASQQKINQFNEEEEYKKQELLKLQNQQRDYQNQRDHTTNQINQLDIDLARIETKLDDLNQEINREVASDKIDDIKKFSGACKNRNEVDMRIANLKHQLELIGAIDQETITEHEQTKTRFDFLKNQTKDLRTTIGQLDKIIDELDTTIKQQFNKSFKSIAENFSKYFKVIFDGGSAKLSLITEKSQEQSVDQEPETENLAAEQHSKITSLGKQKKKHRIISGIDISATPPGKKVKNVHALSGGEKSMTAIALICSIIAANTPPFIILDEVEAALDEANSEKFAMIVKKLAKKTQFVTITHNRATMHHADVLYGVTMGSDGSSNILSVKLEQAQALTKNAK